MLEPFRPARRAPARERREFRRGIYLLPSIFTVGNMFCGYACVVHAMRGELETAAPFIGIAIVLDMLDGRIARMTGTSSAFGLELDSLADVISFGLAPAVLAFAWGHRQAIFRRDAQSAGGRGRGGDGVCLAVPAHAARRRSADFQ